MSCNPSPREAGGLPAAFALIVLCLIGCSKDGPGGDVQAARGTDLPDEAPILDEAERARLLARSEELILELRGQLPALAQSVIANRLPSGAAAELFTDDVSTTALGTGTVTAAGGISIPGITESSWEIEPEAVTRPLATLGLWDPLEASVSEFTEARFTIVDGNFSGRSERVFATDIGFEGLARAEDGSLRAVNAKQVVNWALQPDGRWMINGWHQKSLSTTDAPRPLFRETLDEVIPDEATRQRARFSYHEKNIIDLFTKDRFNVATTNKLYGKYPDLEGLFQHPALSVVDIDRDGWDDLYVMGRWGRNLMLKNNGDGTFADAAPEYALDIEAFCNCAIFADFDNDGDQDAFIGRSLERSLYLVNEDGRFVDRTREMINLPLPFLVSTISAADYNGDGLTDVFLGLYGPSQRAGAVETWAPDFFPPEMVAAMVQQEKSAHRYLARFGPPNLLLKNIGGGKFTIAPEAAQLAEWLNTFQCSWADYDGDGDQDAYMCNDFGPDHLYRNDGDAGDGRITFSEVSKEVSGDAMTGFGMGASWGDYDRDGRIDLYVSNMYSKAGRRITATFDDLDPRVPYAAQGSLLFRNEGERFRQVAGLEPPALLVAKVGWSWGGQFIDVDNDGWLDVYAASGFYTAPDELGQTGDL